MTFYIKTLGCKVNNYESEMISEQLINNGYVYDEINPKYIIINTCSVTNNADSKSMQMIRQARKNYKDSVIIVVGCLVEASKENLSKIDAEIIIGNHDKSKIIDYINEYNLNRKQIISLYNLTKSDFEDMLVTNYNSKTRAFVKIQDGCNNYCSYCIIPFLRGNLRSKDFDLAIKEIENLANHHEEVVLTGIHTGSYNSQGKDLTDLIKEISKINKLKRIRISSIEITEINDKFLTELKNNNKICDHLHIPIQSGSNEILKAMNRKYDKEYFIEKIETIRKIRPNINITTDLIVGFPNETEEKYHETLETLKTINFGKIHVFPYSIRKGTKAAEMINQIPNNIKHRRAKEIYDLSKIYEISYAKRFINCELEVLIESAKENSVGHTSNYLEVVIDEKLIPQKSYLIVINDINQDIIKGILK